MIIAPAPTTEQTIDEILAYHGEEEEAEYRAEKRVIRLERCGSYDTKVNNNGELTWYPTMCGIFRECDRCKSIRAKNHINELRSTGYQIAILKMSDDVAVMLGEELGKEFFRRYPVENGCYLVVPEQFARSCITSDAGQNDGITLIESELDMRLIAKMIDTPEGRRTSGRLGRKYKEVDKNRTKLKKCGMGTTAAREIEDMTFQNVMHETKELDPKSAEELQEAIEIREELYKEKIKALGGEIVTINTIYEYITPEEIKRIDWIESYKSRFSNRKIITYS